MWGIDMSKVYLEDSVLTDIADAIRDKTQKSGLITPADMPDEIESISGGGGEKVDVVCNVPSVTAYQTGLIGHLSSVDWSLSNINNFIIKFGSNTTGMNSIFNYTTDANFIKNHIILDFTSFNSKTAVTVFNVFTFGLSAVVGDGEFDVKEIRNCDIGKLKLSSYNSMFANSIYIETLSDKIINFIESIPYNNTGNGASSIFTGCWHLRGEAADSLRQWVWNQAASANSWGTQLFYYNSYLRSISLPYKPESGTVTSNVITINGNNFTGTGLQHFLFDEEYSKARNDYYFPKLTLDLSTAGWSPNTPYLDADKKITNAATYEALKDDPEAWTTDVGYSFYNLTSAIETVQNLPNMKSLNKYSNGKTGHTIKFKGTAGQSISGQKIQNMTSSTIAIATNKGWTVTMV